MPQAAPPAPVFGDATSQTNGGPTTTTASQDNISRPFGFGFGGAKNETASQQDQNLFFQCMNQNSGSSPSLTGSQTQTQDINYFTTVSESLSKEPPCLFKPANSTEGLTKPEQHKVPETLPTGNGVLNKSSAAFQGIGGSAGGRGSGLSLGGLNADTATQTNCKKNSNNGSSPGGSGVQTSFNSSESHQNLFLQGSKEPTNPFLAYGDKTSHKPFAGLSGAEPQTLGPASDSKPNLFTMTEPPKGILSSPFPALSAGASPSSSSSLAPASSQRPQTEGTVTKDGHEAGEIPTSTSGYPLFGSTGSGDVEEVPVSFDQSQSQNFTLEDRSQSSRRDSESSSNSDLSDLSDNEDGPDKSQIPEGPPHPVKDGAVLEKTKMHGAKSRSRSKPFKGMSSPPFRTSPLLVVSNRINVKLFSAVGQSVLKDQNKVRRLKQSGESFLQDGSCISVAPHLHKCRECRLERYRKYRNTDEDSDDDDPNVACRFFHFRRYEATIYCFVCLKDTQQYCLNRGSCVYTFFFCNQVGFYSQRCSSCGRLPKSSTE